MWVWCVCWCLCVCVCGVCVCVFVCVLFLYVLCVVMSVNPYLVLVGLRFLMEVSEWVSESVSE